MDEIRRWKYLQEPGEGLLLTQPDPDAEDEAGTPAIVRQARRLQQWMGETGMAPSEVWSTPLVSTPLPLYSEGITDGRRRWAGLRAHVMWHPLMWLPPRLAEPYLLVTEDGERPESMEEWAVRVALELTASGMYDPDTGGWVDVLALHDIDIEASGQVERIAAWLYGAPDAELDQIDLDPYVTSSEDPDWAVQVAAGVFEDLVAGAWSITAADLVSIAQGMDTPELSKADVSEVCRMGAAWAGDAVIDLDLNLGTRLRRSPTPWSTWAMTLLNSAGGRWPTSSRRWAWSPRSTPKHWTTWRRLPPRRDRPGAGCAGPHT